MCVWYDRFVFIHKSIPFFYQYAPSSTSVAAPLLEAGGVD